MFYKNRFLTWIVNKRFLFVFVGIGAALTLIPVVFDGYTGCVDHRCGFIVGTNYRDGLWFLAVTATAFQTWPFQMPNFAGANLTGYHFLPNLLVYILSLIGIPATFSFYQLLPIVYFVSLTLLSIALAKKIVDNKLFVFCFLFFIFFGIPLTLITSLYHKCYIDNRLLINTFQSTRVLESPHTAFSFLLILSALTTLYQKNLKLKQRLFLGLLVFISFGTKFYAAITLLLLIISNEIGLVIKQKKLLFFFGYLIFIAVISAVGICIFYNPFSSYAPGSTFKLVPFATVHHLIEEPTLFYLPKMVLARYYLYEHGWGPRLLAIELFSSLLFVVFYFGSRTVGLIYAVKQIITRKINRLELIILSAIIFDTAFSILFIQKGDWYNPIQFAVAAAFLANIFAAKFMFEVIKQNRPLNWLLFLLIIIVTFPANLVNLGYLKNPARWVISAPEMAGLSFLRRQPNGVVLQPFNQEGHDMAYVSAFTGKPTYVNFTNVLDNAGIDYRKRLEHQLNIEKTDIDRLPVNYIYIPPDYKKRQLLIKKCQQSKKYQQIFNNQTVIIFRKI